MTQLKHPFLVSLHSLEEKIESLRREIKIDHFKDVDLVILDNADFIQMFKITGKTAQHWRDEGLIEYCQIKGKIYYRLSDIQQFLEKARKR